jgi:hypothetical protein
MMKSILIGLGFIFITSLAFSQNDKVYLKNGSKIRGTVIKNYVADTVFIKLREGEIKLPLAVVEEIHFGKREAEKPDIYKNLSYEQGYFKTLKAGAMVGSHSYNNPLKVSPMLEAIYEYHHHPLLNGGVGAGVNFYERYVAFPVYAQYQAVLSKKNRSIFIYGQAGHGFVYANDSYDEFGDVDSGRLLAGGIGFQKWIGKGFIKYQLGISSQRVTEITAPSWIWGWPMNGEQYVTKDRNMNRLVFSVSYSF